VPGSFGWLLTWWGAFVLAALDASLLVFMPFGIDALVIYLVARDQSLFWLYPVLATLGSLTGAAITYWIGFKAGEVGLHRLVPEPGLTRIRERVKQKGAVALAVPAVLPPPFPLTPFILACGGLQVTRVLFFATFGAMRLIRFSAAAVLARLYGRGILQVLESDGFQNVIIAFIVIAVLGTITSAVILWRSARRRPVPAA
jgi:membrane protein YqaA with SNARE-associated domain